ncbi:transmembrane protease serine 12-like [Sarcophilus harrisii]|uniref:Peptidase S1 domain-containing protein n=1 Tax=Sarcophilus harrisii TaxID=9305 RepID=G3VAS6_SARHA|nr:transmembrane protease serine 12-like [Sarcophilus harrisii]
MVKVGNRKKMRLIFLGVALWLAGVVFASPHHQVSVFNKKCGRVPLKNDLEESRIIGGHQAQSGSWPWIVSLQVIYANYSTHFCGGSLIKNKWIITAAHCLENYRDPQVWRAVVGINNLFQSPKTSKKMQIDQIIIHPHFVPEKYVNDIALFHLKKAVNYNKYIQPICLPFFDFLPNLTRRTRCFISGWGQTRNKGPYSSILQEAEVHYIPRNTCNSEESYDEIVPYTSFCAGEEDGTVDTCLGDSGGPLMCYIPESKRYFLMGITSFGSNCGKKSFPGVYTGVQFYKMWVNNILLLAAAEDTDKIKIVQGKTILIVIFIILLLDI